MRIKLVKDDIEIVKSANNGFPRETAVLWNGERAEDRLQWREEEIDGIARSVLTLAEINEQLKIEWMGLVLNPYLTTVFMYDQREGGVIYQYGNTGSRWAKLGDLYPTHA